MGHIKTLPVLVGAAFIFFITAASFIRPQGLVAFFDVGQGDAILITTTSGEDILIDGGDNDRVLDYLGTFLPLWDRDIEVLILTHPHADHLKGLISVLQRYEVDRIFCACEGGDSELYNIWMQEAERDAAIEDANTPTEILFQGGGRLRLYHPPAQSDGLNDQSLVVYYEEFGKKYLLMGDASQESEQWMSEQGILEDVDVLKVAHHGSSTASSDAFLRGAKPEVSIISVGTNNSYGHPHQKTLQALNTSQSETLRTDEVGTIVYWLQNGHWNRSIMKEQIMPLMLDLWYNL